MIITDYNHGLISKKIGSFISKKFKNKYSLNCQLNSSNMRYQALSKYKNMKLVVINETELRYEFRDRTSKVDYLAKRLMKKLNIEEYLLPQRRGMSYFNKKNPKSKTYKLFQIMQWIKSVQETLYWLSLMNNQILAPTSLYMASLAARHSVRDIANKNPFDKQKLVMELIIY